MDKATFVSRFNDLEKFLEDNQTIQDQNLKEKMIANWDRMYSWLLGELEIDNIEINNKMYDFLLDVDSFIFSDKFGKDENAVIKSAEQLFKIYKKKVNSQFTF